MLLLRKTAPTLVVLSCAVACGKALELVAEPTSDAGTSVDGGADANGHTDAAVDAARDGDAGGSDASPPSKRVFVSNAKVQGSVTVAEADMVCQSEGGGPSFVAWLSTATTDAVSRLAEGTWKRPDGELVFADKATIASGRGPARSLSFTADGTPLPGTDVGDVTVWTGTANNGIEHVTPGPLGTTCMDWTSGADSTAEGTTGWPANTAAWSQYAQVVCTQFRRLLCFER